MKKFLKNAVSALVLGCTVATFSFTALAEDTPQPPEIPPDAVVIPDDIDNVEDFLDHITDEINGREREEVTTGNPDNRVPTNPDGNGTNTDNNGDGRVQTPSEIPEFTMFILPPGNGSVVDDLTDIDWLRGMTRQFITVQSRSGATYYIIIENDGSEQNVYFLNAVDDWDLLAFSEDFPDDFLTVMHQERVRRHEEYLAALENQGKEPGENDYSHSPLAPTAEGEEVVAVGSNAAIYAVIVIAVIGGIGFYVWKKKKSKSGGGSASIVSNEAEIYEEDDGEDEE